jgi:hypothetical protein
MVQWCGGFVAKMLENAGSGPAGITSEVTEVVVEQ